MNEGLYLEAMNQLKEINDQREKQNEKINEELLELKTELELIYKVVERLDIMNSSEQDGKEFYMQIRIDTLLEYLNQLKKGNCVKFLGSILVRLLR